MRVYCSVFPLFMAAGVPIPPPPPFVFGKYRKNMEAKKMRKKKKWTWMGFELGRDRPAPLLRYAYKWQPIDLLAPLAVICSTSSVRSTSLYQPPPPSEPTPLGDLNFTIYWKMEIVAESAFYGQKEVRLFM